MDSQMNFNDVIFNYYFLIGTLFISYLIYRFIYSLFGDSNFMQTKYKDRGHTWRSIQCNKSIPYNIHCTLCLKLMLPTVGLFCECCAASACKKCYKIVDKKILCKQVTWPIDKPFLHHWINVGVARGETAEHEENVKKYFCSWCQRIISFLDCEQFKSEVCDFQKYRHFIIPPSCIQIEKKVIKVIKPLPDDNWEPLIVIANRKSGSNRGDEVLSLFRGLLNPVQVVDISTNTPESVVRWLPPKCRVLVCGGDGTVAWVLNSLAGADHVKASVAILPMGTGNDLSRVLGWGPGCPSHLDPHAIIDGVKQATHQLLDRWKVTIKPQRSRLCRLRADRVLYAYNYASIGVDAQVALDFHHARTQFLYRYASRTLNYVAYAFLGVGRALDAGGCDALERRLRVFPHESHVSHASPEPLSLPPLQALVALNISSWGAGVDLWCMGNEGEVPEQRIDDGQLEVVGISSSFHIARLQCGLAEPYRFTQTSRLTIELQGSCAMQVDGEPWMQGPATIHLQHSGHSLMLRAPTHQA